MPDRDIRDEVEDARISGASGKGVDLFGGLVPDPTKNVIDLVHAESRYQTAMRDSAEKFQNAIRDAENRRLQAENKRLEDLHHAESRRLEDLARAETTRVDALEEQRVRYETRIAEDLKVNVKTTSDQLAGQLIKETGALYNQITTLTTSVTNQVTTLSTSVTNQIASISTGINTRLADLERFRWETGGKSAVADPALTLAMSEMAKSITALREDRSRYSGRDEEKGESKDAGLKTAAIVISAVVGILGIIAGIILAMYGLPHH